MVRTLRLGLLLLLALQSGCFTMKYLLGQSLGQLQLLRARRKVVDVLADPGTPPVLRERLRLAMEARQFGIEVLGLRGDAEFTRFIDNRGPIVYNLTAAERTRLKPLSWRFPLVGRVPYLGFFSKQSALAQARALEARGFDTYVRPTGGYSTLGYLLSPIYASMIDEPGPRGEVRAVETILHEMAHTTAWIQSASDLNESFATLVGHRGAALFYERRRGGARPRPEVSDAAQAASEERRSQTFAAWLRGALAELQALYRRAAAERWPLHEILRRREEVFQRISQTYRTAFPGASGRLARGPLNNAVLLSFGVYHAAEVVRERKAPSGRQLQQDLLASVSGDLAAYVRLYRRAQDRPDGAAWLRELAAEYRASRRPPHSPGETTTPHYHQN